MSATFEIETTWSKSSRLAWLVLALFLLSGAPLAGGAAVFQGAPVLGGALFVVSAAMWTGIAVLVRHIAKGKRALVRASDEGVRLGEELIPRAAIASGFFVPLAGRLPAHVKLLDARGGELARVHVDGSETASRMLSALGLGATQHVAKFLAVAPGYSLSTLALVLGMVGGLALFTLGMILHAPWLSAIAMAVAIASPIAFVGADIHVGADGLLVKHRLGARFFPWSEVDAVEPYGRGIVVHTGKRATKLPITSRAGVYYDYEKATQAALLDRAREALAAYRRGDAVDLAARLARRGRTEDAWIRALSDLGGDFRSAPVVDEALLRVVESPTAETTARAGAAFALVRAGGDPARARLRIAAEACASPRLRVVLERAADGAGESDLREALAEIEDEMDAERARAPQRSAGGR